MDHRRTQDWTFASAAPQVSSSLDRPADIGRSHSSLENRRTQEWTFASAAPSNNSHLGGEWFQSNEEDDYMALESLPQGTHNPHDSLTVSHHHENDSLSVVLPPRAATSLEVSRFSSSSLIDLDMSFADQDGGMLRPSTEEPEPESAISESWGHPFRTPLVSSFDLSGNGSLPSSSREPSLYIPDDVGSRFNREPSIYIPDDLVPRSNREPSLYIPEGPIPRSNREPSLYISDDAIPKSNREPSLYVAADSFSPNGSVTASSIAGDEFALQAVPSTPTSERMVMTPPSDSNDFSDDAERAQQMNGGGGGGGGVNGHVAITVEEHSDADSDAPMPALPYMPRPPTVNVLQGTASQDDVKDELQRMIRSLHEHLQYTGTVMRTLPVRGGQAAPAEVML